MKKHERDTMDIGSSQFMMAMGSRKVKPTRRLMATQRKELRLIKFFTIFFSY
jgi:hypothetical protein